MDDTTLATDEARRVALHNSMKSQVERDVNADITQRAQEPARADALKVERVARGMRDKAIDETVGTEHAVERARGLARVSQVIDYLFYVVYTLLAVRLGLQLMAARSEVGFVRFIRSVTDPFYAPFRGIVASPTADGGYTLALPIVVAIVIYALLHAGINGLLRLMVHRKTDI